MSEEVRDPLPVHGFVLAGGQSSRMGRDKALLEVGGTSMVEVAVQKLRSFCAEVTISGNREDLARFAPVVSERRLLSGPAAGIEAGLRASQCPWAVFVPVDVPLVPAELLRAWVETVLAGGRDGLRLSTLRAGGERQPTFCALHTDCLPALEQGLSEGVLKLGALFQRIGANLGPKAVALVDAEAFAGSDIGTGLSLALIFSNVNTPEDLAALPRLPTVRLRS